MSFNVIIGYELIKSVLFYTKVRNGMNELKIIICYNNKTIQSILSQAVQYVADVAGINVNIESIGSLRRLSFELDMGYYDIALLDTEIQGECSIEVIRRMRRQGVNTSVIFLSKEIEKVTEIFDLNIFAFKNAEKFTFEQFRDLILRVLIHSSKKQRSTIRLKTKEGEKHIPISNIIYIESDMKGNRVHLVSGEICTSSDSLRKYEEALRVAGFIKSHRSFLVNVEWIESISKKNLRFANQDEVPIGLSYYPELIELVRKKGMN